MVNAPSRRFEIFTVLRTLKEFGHGILSFFLAAYRITFKLKET